MKENSENGICLEGEMAEQFALMLAHDAVQAYGLSEPRAIEKVGETLLTAGRLLIRGVPVATVASLVQNVLQVPDELALEVANRLHEKVFKSNFTDTQGKQLKLVIPEQTDYSFEADGFNRSRYLSECYSLFMGQDYSSCVDKAMEALNIYSHAMHCCPTFISCQQSHLQWTFLVYS